MTSYTVDRNVPWPVPIWDADAVRLIAQDLGSGAYAVVADTAEQQTAQGIPQPTSGHGDHFFGNYRMPRSARIIQHENAFRAIEQTGIEPRKLVEQVRRAVTAGMSLEETRKTVTMREFDAGYPLFEWLHFGVDIPCAYHEAEQSRAA